MSQVSKPDQFIDAVADYFDGLIPQATDDQLFAAGYLRGHFDLAVGSLEVEAEPFEKPQLCNWVEQSLLNAIAGGELASEDQAHVRQIWQQVQLIEA